MTLHIVASRDTNQTDNLTNFYITHAMMQMPSVHMFLASHTWDEVEVDVSDDIPRCTLQYLLIGCKNIHVTHIPEEVTPHTIGLLTDLYPDKAGAIRSAYMLNGNVQEILQNG